MHKSIMFPLIIPMCTVIWSTLRSMWWPSWSPRTPNFQRVIVEPNVLDQVIVCRISHFVFLLNTWNDHDSSIDQRALKKRPSLDWTQWPIQEIVFNYITCTINSWLCQIESRFYTLGLKTNSIIGNPTTCNLLLLVLVIHSYSWMMFSSLLATTAASQERTRRLVVPGRRR